MTKRILSLACLLGTVSLTPAVAASSFQDTCSQIRFAYAGNLPVISAVCLRINGTANPTSLMIEGVENANGILTQTSASGSFHESCGNIQISIIGNTVILSAHCRNAAGAFTHSSIPLDNIINSNGVLAQ